MLQFSMDNHKIQVQ